MSDKILPRIAEIITEELSKGLKLGLPSSENLRVAAWYVMEEFPEAKASDFGQAAAACGLHRQGAINRWNEAKANAAL